MKQLRQKLNENVREWGNRKFFVPMTGGLGDLLTANINFRRVGATAGILAPLVGLSFLFSEGGESPILGAINGTVIYFCGLPITALASAWCGGLGYQAGERVDYTLGDTETPRTRTHYLFLEDKAENLRRKAEKIDERMGDDERPLMAWYANRLRTKAERLQRRAGKYNNRFRTTCPVQVNPQTL